MSEGGMSIQEKAETLARGVLHDELANLQIEIGRLRAENAEYWRAASAIAQALTDEAHAAALTRLNEIRLGNGYAHVPEPAVKLALEREARLAGELATLRQRVETLTAALRGTSTMKSQWGTPCWCRTLAMLYCVGQPQCKAAQAELERLAGEGG